MQSSAAPGRYSPRPAGYVMEMTNPLLPAPLERAILAAPRRGRRALLRGRPGRSRCPGRAHRRRGLRRRGSGTSTPRPRPGRPARDPHHPHPPARRDADPDHARGHRPQPALDRGDAHPAPATSPDPDAPPRSLSDRASAQAEAAACADKGFAARVERCASPRMADVEPGILGLPGAGRAASRRRPRPTPRRPGSPRPARPRRTVYTGWDGAAPTADRGTSTSCASIPGASPAGSRGPSGPTCSSARPPRSSPLRRGDRGDQLRLLRARPGVRRARRPGRRRGVRRAGAVGVRRRPAGAGPARRRPAQPIVALAWARTEPVGGTASRWTASTGCPA